MKLVKENAVFFCENGGKNLLLRDTVKCRQQYLWKCSAPGNRPHTWWKWKSLSCIQFFATHGLYRILQARILEWVVFPFSRGSSNPWIKPRSPALQKDFLPVEPQGSPRILEWVAYPFSRELPNPGIESESPALQADSLPTKLSGKPIYTVGSDAVTREWSSTEF